ncbi:phosphatidylethanolamine-binding protein 4 [Halichoeres trimaculatus]|uniref:phosphatidylethanolamine-binding protein 4 n=1 Tax=Halichoeres trimaculatus TaxID=147232 RepID=UPI003D9F432F
MAVLAMFLVLCTCVWGFHQVEATADNLCLQESSFCHGGLVVIYPQLEIHNCVIVPQNLRKKITTEWGHPKIIFPGANKAKKYVLVMVDPDAPSRVRPTSAQWRHWLIVDLKGAALKDGKLDGRTITDYHPPSPPSSSGFHRYQFLVYEQPPNMPLPQEETSPRGKWDLQAFTSRFSLGKSVATQVFLTKNFKD